MFVCFVTASFADTTIDAMHHNAYGSNTGWIEARGDVTHGAVIGQYYCEGYIYSANCGWISLGNVPKNGHHYGNAASDDWGVNHDGEGELQGYAYGANIGWINFEQTYGKPKVDLRTGNLSGYVWSANTGWISLSNAYAYVRTETLAEGPDSDRDGIPDPWEYKCAGDLTSLGTGDSDSDGVPDLAEYGADTDPRNSSEYLAVTAYGVDAGNTNAVTWKTTRRSRFYRLECTDLLSETPVWRDSGLGVMSPDSGDTMTREVISAGASKRFYRVKAVLPLMP